MEKKTIAKNTTLLATPKILKFFVGIIRAKIVAVFLGTEGAGIIAQLQNILNSISSFTTAGMPDGMVKQIAIANTKNPLKSNIASIIKTYLVTVSIITVVVYSLGFVFSRKITLFVFGSIQYHNYFLIGYTALPVMILSSSSFAIIKAYKRIKSLMWAEFSIIIINFLIFVTLVYFFRLTGAVVYVTISFITTWLIYRYIAQTKILKKVDISFPDILKAPFVKSHFKELAVFAGATFTAGAYQIIIEVTTRSIVVNKLGIDRIGLYSPIVAWAGLFTGFILPALTTYLFPRLSEAKTNQEIVGLINDVMRIMTYAALPFIVIAITIRQYIIPLFYSNEFIEAATYLPFHFIAIFFTIWCYCFAQIFAPTGRIKNFVPIILFNNTLSLALVYFLVPEFGLWGWMAKFTVAPIVAFAIYYIYWFKVIKFRINRENYELFLLIISSSIFILIFRNNIIIASLISIISLIAAWLLLKKGEKLFILNKFKIFKKIKHID